ncbi:MAG: hypothetical protein J7556_03385 [Acidovorax sp.]|nr:hypothetical protein [Acidovorax sp.]
MLTTPSHSGSRHSPWAVLGWISLLLLLMAAAILALMPDVQGLRQLIRATARTSLVLFVLAFTASAQWRLWPGAWSRWLRTHRRQIGLSMAVSHAIHAAAIAGFAWMAPADFMAQTNPGSLATGGLAYAFIALMAATSFDRTAAWLGPRAWRGLHWAGMYYLWISFLVAFGKRLPQSEGYALPMMVLAAALALRLWPAARSRRAG